MSSQAQSSQAQHEKPPHRYNDLQALFINTTLKASAQGPSHTERLMRKSMAILRSAGARTEYLRAADHHIAFGIQPDMRKEGMERDDWPDQI
jgi:hypothetical protein